MPKYDNHLHISLSTRKCILCFLETCSSGQFVISYSINQFENQKKVITKMTTSDTLKMRGNKKDKEGES